MHAVLGTWHDSGALSLYFILASILAFLLQLQIVDHLEHEWDNQESWIHIFWVEKATNQQGVADVQLLNTISLVMIDGLLQN